MYERVKVKYRNTLKSWLVATLVACLFNIEAVAMDVTFAGLIQNVERGCPVVWEDPAVPIDDSLAVTTLFDSEGDRNEFIALYHETNDVVDPSTGAVTDPISQAEMDAVLASIGAISFECNAHRKVLLESMLTTNSLDSAAALEAALGVADAIDFSSRHWRVGDIRLTGRNVADQGWIFPIGQTVGADGSGADLMGEEYKALFERANDWVPNSGTKTWGAAGAVGIVTLPDMRGRSIFAADNMGGSVAGVITLTEGSQLGASFGRESKVLDEDQMPRHTHIMNSTGNHRHSLGAVSNHTHSLGSAGSHSHSMGYAGNHGHSLRTSVHGGSGQGRSDYPYFEGRARPNYQNTIPSSVQQAGNHKHSLGSAGSHNHSVGGAGSHTHSMGNAGSHRHTNQEVGGG